MPQPFRSPQRLAAVVLTVVFFALGIGRGWDPVSSFDSVRYANVGHWLTEGRGVSASVTVVPVQEGTADRGGGLHAFTIQPPGLPLLYAATGVGRRAGLHRVLNVAGLVILGWLVGLLGMRLTGDAWAAGLAALLTVSSPVVLESAGMMWTDLPFTVLTLGAVCCVVRSAQGCRSLAWLAAGAFLAGLALLLRYPALGLVLLFVMDAVLAWRRDGARTAMVRLGISLGIFGLFALPVLGRNQVLAGSWTGVAPRAWPLAPAPDPLRAWSFLGSRLLQTLVPGFLSQGANEFLVSANRNPAGWWVPRLVGSFVLAGGLWWTFARRRAGNRVLPDGWSLLLAAVLGYLVVILAGLLRHDEVHVAEFRYLAPVAPALFLGVAALVGRIPGRALARGVAVSLAVMFLAGAMALPRPAAGDHGFLRDGLDWIGANVPAEAAILTNGGKVLLEEDLSRRVHHLSVWHHRHLLPEEYRSEEGLHRFLAERDIRYVVLIGKPDRRKVVFWGRPMTSLFTGQVWTDRLVYRDAGLLVFRVPETVTQYRGGTP